ncbi:IBR finger domain protein [Hypomontagnella monticulosa]|nr:IBR finger domain protein [Hypomontagnella monticulosa]
MAAKRTILISLGSALAISFHKARWRVFASARNMSKLKQAEAIGIETIQLDISSDESIKSCVSRVQELTGGSLDALVNNAGAGYSLPLMDIGIDKARKLFDLNVFLLFSVTRAFLPLMLKSAHGALLINNTSAASLTVGAVPFQGAYNASKAAAANLTEVLRLELAPFGIKVINLVTGSVKSTFFDNSAAATLPPTSMYNVAKETIEKAMSGEDTAANGIDAFEWAEQVVKDTNMPHPLSMVWRGRYALQAWVGSLFPVGFFDSLARRKVGLDVLERNIREQGGRGKIKLS